MVTTGWLQELVRGFDSEKTGVVVGEVVPYPPQTSAERYTAMRKPRLSMRTSHPDFPWFATGNVAFRRKVFDHIGLFDPQMLTGEDVDISWRFFQNKNFKLVYRPKSVVFHRHRVTTWGLFKQYQGYGYGQVILSRKYRDKLSWNWRRELRAYGDISRAILGLARAAILFMIKGRDATRFSYLYCDLACKLGARIGFIRGMLRRVSEYG